jgi:uncharacterized membrane protein
MKQETSINNQNIPYVNQSGKIIQFAALFLLMLVVGVFWGNWFSFSRSYDVFSVDELNHIAKTIIRNLAVPMRFISMACIVMMSLSAYFIPQKRSKEFYFNLFAIAFILVTLLITIIVEVPINDQVITWTTSTAPSDWKEILDRWLYFNKIRTAAALISFALFTAAILTPFKKVKK